MKKKSSITAKVWISYSLLFIIPILFLVYLISNPNIRHFVSQDTIPFPIKITLFLGGLALVLMSLAGIMMIRRSFSSLSKLVERAAESYR